MVRGGAVIVAAALALATCNVEVGVDERTFACTRDADCGAGASCVAGACVPLPTGRTCTTRTRSGVTTRFEVSADRTLVVAFGDRRSRPFALPADVVAIEDDPVEGCCESHCCTERP